MKNQNNLSWKPVSELPIDTPCRVKMLLLIEGTLSSDFLYVLTDYWTVRKSDEDLGVVEGTDLKVKLEDGTFAYGHFSRGLMFHKIKAWMFERDLVNLYNG